jgi:hypothetical protein
MTNAEIDAFMRRRVKVTLLDGTIREGELLESPYGPDRVFVKGALGYHVLRNVIATIEPRS